MATSTTDTLKILSADIKPSNSSDEMLTEAVSVANSIGTNYLDTYENTWREKIETNLAAHYFLMWYGNQTETSLVELQARTPMKN